MLFDFGAFVNMDFGGDHSLGMDALQHARN